MGKLVDAEAAKRGEGGPVNESVDQSADLLANLDLAEKAGMDEAHFIIRNHHQELTLNHLEQVKSLVPVHQELRFKV